MTVKTFSVEFWGKNDRYQKWNHEFKNISANSAKDAVKKAIGGGGYMVCEIVDNLWSCGDLEARIVGEGS